MERYDSKERLLVLAEQYELTPDELLDTLGFADIGVPGICINNTCPDWSDDKVSLHGYSYCNWCGTNTVVSCVTLANETKG